MLDRRGSAASRLSAPRSLLIATFGTVALYGFAAWVYVALVALIQPQTLALPLTHLAKWPRTDTFGEISFAASFVAFWSYTLLRPLRLAHSAAEDRDGQGIDGS